MLTRSCAAVRSLASVTTVRRGITRRPLLCGASVWTEDVGPTTGTRWCSSDVASVATQGGIHRSSLYAGSFDPPSEGHLDIIKRAMHLCDHLTVAVAQNPNKKNVRVTDLCMALVQTVACVLLLLLQWFSSADRVRLVEEMIAAELGPEIAARTHVVEFSGLVVDFARDNDVDFLVRGLRAYSDFEYEFRMALVNRKLTGIETSFLMADDSMSFVSSSLIREMALFGKMLPNFVPKSIEKEVFGVLGVSLDQDKDKPEES